MLLPLLIPDRIGRLRPQRGTSAPQSRANIKFISLISEPMWMCAHFFLVFENRPHVLTIGTCAGDDGLKSSARVERMYGTPMTDAPIR